VQEQRVFVNVVISLKEIPRSSVEREITLTPKADNCLTGELGIFSADNSEVVKVYIIIVFSKNVRKFSVNVLSLTFSLFRVLDKINIVICFLSDSLLNNSMAKKYTTEEVINLFKEKHGNRYDYSMFVYPGRKNDKAIVICRKHGQFVTSKQHHLKGSGCPECAGVPRGGFKRKSQEEFIEELKKKYDKFYEYDFSKFVYINNTTKGTVICPKHGDFQITPKHLLMKQYGCSECSGKKRLTIEKIRELTLYKIPDQDYINNKTNIKAVCEFHGEWEVRPDNLLHSKTKCPTCAGQLSEIEGDLRKFVESELDDSIIRNDKELLGDRRELDILSQRHKIAIEMNGLYCHSEEQGKDKNYHISKTNKCLQNNIRLFHIFEDEWRNKKDIWKSILRYNFGKIHNKLHARKCEVAVVDNSNARYFLNANHLQGYSNCSISLGLHHDNELVSLLTFGKSRFDNNIEWEIIRFANKIDTTVVGGFQKLFKHFIKTYNPCSIVSYADKRYSIGNLYRNVGMKEISNNAINYYYFNKRQGVRYSRHLFQKHKLKDKLPLFDGSLSEVMNMRMNGFNRIYDCGNYKFTWYKNEETGGSSAPPVSDLT
jgi:hypothetical protein